LPVPECHISGLPLGLAALTQCYVMLCVSGFVLFLGCVIFHGVFLFPQVFTRLCSWWESKGKYIIEECKNRVISCSLHYFCKLEVFQKLTTSG
jgi:hypothetical protein